MSTVNVKATGRRSSHSVRSQCALAGAAAAAALFTATASLKASVLLYYTFDNDTATSGGINDSSGLGHNGSAASARNNG